MTSVHVRAKISDCTDSIVTSFSRFNRTVRILENQLVSFHCCFKKPPKPHCAAGKASFHSFPSLFSCCLYPRSKRSCFPFLKSIPTSYAQRISGFLKQSLLQLFVAHFLAPDLSLPSRNRAQSRPINVNLHFKLQFWERCSIGLSYPER